MTKTTKQLMAESFKRLLTKKPFSKITISDITEDCGVSRMTFYYHFQDIYDMVSWVVLRDAEEIMGGPLTRDNWQKIFTDLGYGAIENRVMLENLFHSMGREKIEDFLYHISYEVIGTAVEKSCREKKVSEEGKRFITDFFKYAIVGIEVNWVREGMKERPEQVTRKLAVILEGQLDLAACNFSKEKSY